MKKSEIKKLYLSRIKEYKKNSFYYYEKNSPKISDAAFDELKKEIESHCNLFVRKYLSVSENAKFYLQNSWSVKHNPGDKAQIHSHGNSLLSGVYYLKTNTNTGNLVFHKNHIYTNTFHQSIRFDYDESNNLNTGQYIMDANEGKIFIFPSHLEHSVEENKSNEQRYSLAFNFYVRGDFGKEEYILEIK